MAVRWGPSVLDWRDHAVDTRADHPAGAYLARCGHTLLMVTLLSERPRHCLCEQCAARHLARAVVNSRDRERLAATDWALGEVLTLADEAPALTDEQLRQRLSALIEALRCQQ